MDTFTELRQLADDLAERGDNATAGCAALCRKAMSPPLAFVTALRFTRTGQRPGMEDGPAAMKESR